MVVTQLRRPSIEAVLLGFFFFTAAFGVLRCSQADRLSGDLRLKAMQVTLNLLVKALLAVEAGKRVASCCIEAASDGELDKAEVVALQTLG